MVVPLDGTVKMWAIYVVAVPDLMKSLVGPVARSDVIGKGVKRRCLCVALNL